MSEQNGISGVCRVELPSGGWWEIKTRLTWGEQQDIVTEAAKEARSETDTGMFDTVIARVSAGWSFDEPITVETIRGRDGDDVMPVLTEVLRTFNPLLRMLAQIGNS